MTSSDQQIWIETTVSQWHFENDMLKCITNAASANNLIRTVKCQGICRHSDEQVWVQYIRVEWFNNISSMDRFKHVIQILQIINLKKHVCLFDKHIFIIISSFNVFEMFKKIYVCYNDNRNDNSFKIHYNVSAFKSIHAWQIWTRISR